MVPTGIFFALFKTMQKKSRTEHYISAVATPPKKFGVTMHFSQITKLQLEKKTLHALLCILLLFIVFISEKSMVTPIFFFDFSIALAKICFPRLVINRVSTNRRPKTKDRRLQNEDPR